MGENERMFSLALNGEWTLAHCAVGTGSFDSFRNLETIRYDVPDAVHSAFISAGLIPEPLVDDCDAQCRWLESEEFWCVRRFLMEQDEMRQRMLLRFDGLDTTADIWLNGVMLGRCSNAFVEHVFDVTALVQPGGNELVVRIDQGLNEVQDKPMLEMGCMWNNVQPYRAWMRKPQYVYGWDWTIWLPSCGIWRDVMLEGHDEAYLGDLYCHPAGDVLTAGTEAELLLDCELICLRDGQYEAVYEVQDADGMRVARGTAALQTGENRLRAQIASARLWHPNGVGEPHCYQVTICLRDGAGRLLQMLRRTVGLRTAAIRQERLNDQESGFTFVINGEPVFCKGANVVPADCLPGRVTGARERALIALAADAHMNMLRVWGGGVYASEAFLEECDRRGILVWHDFMYACGYYPDHDADFRASITDEAEKAIRRLRNHPCVIGWSGNNEVQEMYVGQQKWKKPFPFYGERIYTELLPGLVKAMHPGAVYRESSPMGDPRDPADSLMGDQHIWHFTHRPNDPLYLDLWRFTDFPVKFLSEFGVIGAMTRETTESCLSPEHRDPEDPVWLHHVNESQEHVLLNRFMEVYFGGFRGLSLQQFILRSQAIQAEILRHIYDEFRARKFVCSGILFWTLGDSMGIHNWSLIDYGMRRKPAYHAMKRAMAPVAPVIRGYDVQSFSGMRHWREFWTQEPELLEIWGVNDVMTEQQVRVVWRVMTLQGEILRRGEMDAMLPANASRQVAQVVLDGLAFDPAQTILHVAMTCGDGRVSENRYFFAPFCEMLTRHARPACRVERMDANTYRLHLKCDCFVWQLHIAEPAGVYASDNDFDLLPGEECVVTVTTDVADYVPELHWVGEE